MVDEEKVRAEIVNAASLLIQQYGIQRVTMLDIAKKAGKSKSALYYYFKKKEDILEAVVIQEMDLFFRSAKASVDQKGSFTDMLSSYIRTKIDLLTERRQKFQLLIENDSHFFDFRTYFKKMRFLNDQKEIQLIKRILNTGVEEGVIDPTKISRDNEDLAAEILLTGVRGLEMEIFVMDELLDIDRRIDLMLKIFLYGLS